jgi:hypoxanthine phosphoribosyltransferase
VPQGASDVVLFAEAEIAARIRDMAREIAALPAPPDLAVPILAGAFMFAADLLRALAREGVDLATEFVWLRAYGQGQSAGNVRVLNAPSEMVRGRHTLLIDGVLESGGTALRARQLLEEAGAASVRFAVAVEKPYPARAIAADFIGFQAGPEFLFGYGMDIAGEGRGLPDIRRRSV